VESDEDEDGSDVRRRQVPVIVPFVNRTMRAKPSRRSSE
jgi:hypothetical protein